MIWKKWKLGLLVAALTGGLMGLTTVSVVDNITWQQLTVLLLINAAKDMLLFLRDHPVDSIILPLLIVALLTSPGCARFTTTQTDTSYEQGKPLRTITTKASSSTFFDSKSNLAKWKASQTDKTQGAEVGGLGQESSGTNAVDLVDKLIGTAITSAIKAVK